MPQTHTRQRFSRQLKLWRLNNIDPAFLTGLCALVLVIIVGNRLWRGYGDASAARQEALHFASAIREAQVYARDNNRYVVLRISADGPDRTATYVASDDASTFIRQQLPQSVSASALIRLDDQGRLLKPTSIVFRRGCCTVQMNISQAGEISFPSN